MTGTASAGVHRDVPASRSLDSTDRFDIGRYELTSVESKPAFFTMGVMNASLNTAGKQPSDMDLLNSSVMNGANKSPTCFNTDVGMGSAAECLSGSDRRIPLMTSSVVNGKSRCRDRSGRPWRNLPSRSLIDTEVFHVWGDSLLISRINITGLQVVTDFPSLVWSSVNLSEYSTSNKCVCCHVMNS